MPTLIEGYLQSPSNLSLADVATLVSHEVNLVIQVRWSPQASTELVNSKRVFPQLT